MSKDDVKRLEKEVRTSLFLFNTVLRIGAWVVVGVPELTEYDILPTGQLPRIGGIRILQFGTTWFIYIT